MKYSNLQLGTVALNDKNWDTIYSQERLIICFLRFGILDVS